MATTPQFLVTEECGRLARWIRLMGYDAAQMPATPVSALYRRAYNEGRVIVTRNRRVGSSGVVRVVQLAAQGVAEQLRQVMRDAGFVVDPERMLTRCDQCNVEVQLAEKSQVSARVPPYVFEMQQRFRRCPSCQRIYWAGTHCARISEMLKRL